jgi:hypothetical protein
MVVALEAEIRDEEWTGPIQSDPCGDAAIEIAGDLTDLHDSAEHDRTFRLSTTRLTHRPRRWHIDHGAQPSPNRWLYPAKAAAISSDFNPKGSRE